MVDALAILASTWEGERQMKVKPLILVKSRILYYEEIRIMSINPIEKLWFHDLHKYLETGLFPDDADIKERRSLRMLSHQFINHKGMLYKRAPIGVHLRCVDKTEAQRLMEEIHEGVYSPHVNGIVLAKKIA